MDFFAPLKLMSQNLTIQSPVVTICTISFKIQLFYILLTQCTLCGSEKKQRLFPYTTLT